MPSSQQPATTRTTAVTTAAVVVVVVCLALTAWSAVRLTRGSTPTAVTREEAAREAVLAAASQVAVNFTTLDYRTLTQDFKQLGDLATPAYRKQFLTQTPATAELIVKAKASSKGQVVARAVQNLEPQTNPTSAEVILAVNDTITNTSNPKGAVQYYRFDIKLQKVGGRWLASAVNPV